MYNKTHFSYIVISFIYEYWSQWKN